MKKQKTKTILKGLSCAFLCGSLFLTSCSTDVENWLDKTPSEDTGSKDEVSEFKKLTAPQRLRYDAATSTIAWNEVYGATSYSVNINGVTVKTSLKTNSYKYDEIEPGVSYLISVKAHCNTKDYKDSHYASIYYSLQNVSSSNFSFRLADNGQGIEITGLSASANEEKLSAEDNVTIPSEIEGYKVIGIAEEAFRRNDVFKSLTLADTIEWIAEEAFYNSKIPTVILNEGLKEISASAFESSKLTSIVIPSSVETIGAKAFNDSSLKTLEFAANGKLTTISEKCFASTSLTDVTIPSNIVAIEKEAFARTSTIKTLTFAPASNLKTIGNSAFIDMTALKSVVIPASVETLEEGAFKVTSGKTGVYETFMFESNSNVKYFGKECFNGLVSSKSKSSGDYSLIYFGPEIETENLPTESTLIIPASVETIADMAFNNSKFIKIDFESGSVLKEIGDSAFDTSAYLTSVKFPNSLEKIGKNAFSSCSSLEKPELNELESNLKFVHSTSFSGNSWLKNEDKVIFCGILLKDTTQTAATTLIIEEGIKYISDGVYANHSFTTISFPSTFKGICDGTYSPSNKKSDNYLGAFEGNISLTSISFPDSVEYIGDMAFSGCYKVSSIDFGNNSNLYHIGQQAFDLLNNATEEIKGENGKVDIVEVSRSLITNLSIPSSVKFIEEKAFYRLNSLTSINFDTNSQLESIGSYAFAYITDLSSFNLPASVVTISDHSFAAVEGVTNLLTFTIDTNSKLETIGANAFENQNKLSSFVLPDSVKTIHEEAFTGTAQLETFTISTNSKLETIERSVFYNSFVSSLYIPKSIIYIASSAFENAHNLTNINFDKDAFINAPEENKIFYSNTFRNCSSLISIEIPIEIHTLEANVFDGATNLINITTKAENIKPTAFSNTAFINSFADGLVVINNLVVNYVGQDSNVVIPEGVVGIVDEAFANKKIVSITFPSTLTEIGNNAFKNCSNLQTTTFNNSNLEVIGSKAFINCYNLTNFDFASSLEHIGEFAFLNCKSLIKADLSNTKLNTIEFATFANCSSLASLKLPANLKTIEAAAFFYNQISVIEVPNSLSTIGEYAFAFNIKGSASLTLTGTDETAILKEVYDHITYLVSEKTNYNYSITDITFGSASNISHISKYAFAGTSITELNLPSIVDLHLESYAFAYPIKLESAMFPVNVTFDDGVLNGANVLKEFEHNSSVYTFSAFGSTINYIPESLATIIISDGSVAIMDDAFNGYSFVEEIILPDSINHIGNNAFYGCNNLTSINLKNVVTIGDEAFYGCRNLENITFGNSVESIGNKAFCATKWIETYDLTNDFVVVNGILLLYRGTATEVTLPSNVKVIAGGAFSGNATITKITASDSLQKIEQGAFDCATSLKLLVLNGSNVVEIGLNIFDTVHEDFKVDVTDVDNYKNNNIIWSLYAEYLK